MEERGRGQMVAEGSTGEGRRARSGGRRGGGEEGRREEGGGEDAMAAADGRWAVWSGGCSVWRAECGRMYGEDERQTVQ